MSARAVLHRQILYNITNMDDNQSEIKLNTFLGAADRSGGLRDVNGVKSVEVDPHLSPTPKATAQNSPSCGENGNIVTSNKFESGSGSGDHEGGQADDGIDTAAKKRKTRRGKPKHRKLKPYSKQQISYEQRLKSRGIGSRITKTGRHPPAPYNTTQFLMEDHSDLPDLEQKLAGAAAGEAMPVFHKPSAPPRTRDSSFSIDSEDDYFYSSPEDEEEFLTKEFSSAYEDLHAERLGGLTKSELIQEYIQLEGKVDLLTKRLRGKNFHQMEERETTSDNKYSSGTELEIAKKLKIYQQRIDDLIQQNEQLRRENDTLKGQRRGSVVSSVDSESDSDSSSNTSSCSCTENSPIPSLTPSTPQLTMRREHALMREQQKINGSSQTNISNIHCADSDSSDQEDRDEVPAQRLVERSPSVATNSGHISNGQATNQEVNGLPT
ncbi:protein HEXIM1 [Athalia rosae]|uniref:protein HEXIM1 n=1 Tax=Athalia rosae TaxID=37344 RepID=UPI0006253B24|nr:protein HEXIM1 [Athalia rosae]